MTDTPRDEMQTNTRVHIHRINRRALVHGAALLLCSLDQRAALLSWSNLNCRTSKQLGTALSNKHK